MIDHGNVVRLLTASEELLKYSHSDIWAFFSSFVFDVSIFNIWGAFIYGGTLVMASNRRRKKRKKK